jgi:hypothetical protein
MVDKLKIGIIGCGGSRGRPGSLQDGGRIQRMIKGCTLL